MLSFVIVVLLSSFISFFIYSIYMADSLLF